MRSKSIFTLITAALTVVGMLLPGPVFAQSEIDVSGFVSVDCVTASFEFNVTGAGDSFDLFIDFGDSETMDIQEQSTFPLAVDHDYPGSGLYEWTLTASSIVDPTRMGSTSGSLLIGPSVTLTSDIFPPVLTMERGQADLTFYAEVEGDEGPFTFTWDLDGDGAADAGSDPNSATATFSYSAPGKYYASVSVSDDCGLTDSDTLTVVVFDPENPQSACHPRAQAIAQSVDTLYPDQAEQLYSCEDIFGIFHGDLTGSQLGFGRLWHAYQMALSIPELRWEEILDWQLQGSGWGILAQLDKFSDLLDEVGTADLIEKVLSGKATVQDIRTAVRSVLRYEADFEDALSRLADGASPGELGQFYKLANEMQIDPTSLDGYIEEGMTLSVLRHAAKLADRMDAEWSEILDAKSFDHSWGEINQAYRLADEETSAADILVIGIKEFRSAGREEDRNQKTAERLAEQFSSQVGDIMSVFTAECEGSWSCTRKELRQEAHDQAYVDQDARTAVKIASQYSVSESEVWNIYETTCSQEWNCVRAHFRELLKDNQGKGKNK
jgi:PKD repeat protein